MIDKIIENIERNLINYDDIRYLWNQNYENIKRNLLQYIKSRDNSKSTYECNIYYPNIYKIEDNCPTCGYRTPLSRQKYTQKYIVKSIEHRLKDVVKYNFSGINCYNKDVTGLRELFIILEYLEEFDLNVNVALSNYDNLNNLKKYTLNSIIYNPEDISYSTFNEKNNEFKGRYEEKVIKYIKEDMCLKVTYILTLKYNESHQDMYNIIMKLKELNVDYIEVKGFDPFIDAYEEYNPQYSKEYILKIIILLKLYLKDTKLKIQYATNGNNFIKDYYEHRVNILTGIYTKNMNPKLENINIIKDLEKK